MAELVEKRSVERIPVEERTTGFWAMFMLWTGFSISVRVYGREVLSLKQDSCMQYLR